MDGTLSHFLFSLAVSQVLAQLESLNHFEGHPLPKRFSLIPPPPPPRSRLYFFQPVFPHEYCLFGNPGFQSGCKSPCNSFWTFLTNFTQIWLKGSSLRNNHVPTRSVNSNSTPEEQELNSCPHWANIIVSLGSWYSLANPHLLRLALRDCWPWCGEEMKLMQRGRRWAEGYREQVCWKSDLAASSSPHRNYFVAKLNLYCFISNMSKAWLQLQMALFLWR